MSDSNSILNEASIRGFTDQNYWIDETLRSTVVFVGFTSHPQLNRGRIGSGAEDRRRTHVITPNGQ
ncbi:MAG: hypothetical protein ACFBSF_12405 [Leptolyngbyaceae cyanobacterium]